MFYNSKKLPDSLGEHVYILQVDFSVFRSKSYVHLFKDAKDAKHQKSSVLMGREQCNKLEEEWIKASLL